MKSGRVLDKTLYPVLTYWTRLRRRANVLYKTHIGGQSTGQDSTWGANKTPYGGLTRLSTTGRRVKRLGHRTRLVPWGGRGMPTGSRDGG